MGGASSTQRVDDTTPEYLIGTFVGEQPFLFTSDYWQKLLQLKFDFDWPSDRLQQASHAFVAVQLGTSRSSIKDKKEAMVVILNDQVSEPLRASIGGAPLEDARHLARSCDRLCQEVETQWMLKGLIVGMLCLS